MLTTTKLQQQYTKRLIAGSFDMYSNDPVVGASNKGLFIFNKVFCNKNLTQLIRIRSVTDYSHVLGNAAKINLLSPSYSNSNVVSQCFSKQSLNVPYKITAYHRPKNGLFTFPVFDAQVLADYITKQLSSNQQRDSLIAKNLPSGIGRIAVTLFKQLKVNELSNLSGLRIECRGR
jgi:hypothetical protein